MTFLSWLKTRKNEDSPIGDFARDALADYSAPKQNTYNDWHSYLRSPSVRACDEAMAALDTAWQLYDNRSKKKSAFNVSIRTRFLVFKRDNYRCVICGRDQSDGIKLEAGHKIAKAKGGTATPENLVTLCFDCNRGMRTDTF